MMVGLVLGIFVGVLPGLGGPNGVAILLPLTFTMDPTSAIVMLSCIYWGALFGGAITSILFNIPGEAWSVATTFDGYPMAQQGRAAEALTAAFTSSFIGSLVAVLLITFLAPMISSFALKFGPPEFFSVYLLTFCSFVGLGREAKHKTVISMSLGLLLAGVGMDTVSGQLRMTFGSGELLRGVNFLVAVIGLFGISEILLTMEERLALRGHAAGISLRVVLKVWRDLPKYWVTLFRSSFIGCWLGITPGGAIAASFMGYNLAKRFSKDPESFGKGRIEGVFAPETAAHASGTAALLPMLALGIPGSGTAAILLAVPRALCRELPADRRFHAHGRQDRAVEVVAHRLCVHRRDVRDLRHRLRRHHAKGPARSGARPLRIWHEFFRHCEERSDEAIHSCFAAPWVASLRSQ